MKKLIAFIFLFILGLSACTEKRTINIGGLKPVDDEGKLVVSVRSSATTYFRDKEGNPSGFEYDLVMALGEHLKVPVRLLVRESVQQVIEDLKLGKAHLGAAGLTVTEAREKHVEFGNVYKKIQQQIICRKKQRVKKLEDIQKLELHIVSGSSYEERLIQLKKNKFPKLDWIRVKNASSDEIIEDLWKRKKGCTIADDHIVSVHRRYFPELRVVFTFPEEEGVAWAFSEVDSELKDKVNSWLKGAKNGGLYKKIHDRYFGFIEDFDYYDTKKFMERIHSRLPKYKKIFQAAARKYGFHWTFLAAVSYQESQWDPKAVSPTGVRGLMMLTRNTAKEMGVKDRTDPKESIMGGAKYLKKTIKRLPRYIPSKERKWMALASYNVGYYHLRDARALSIMKEKNPNLWVEVKEVLPLLSQRKYYKRLPYGYARGMEPVIYIERIRNYHDILKKYLETRDQLRRPADKMGI